ncbi:MAG: 7,8-dihydro-8-oxoguanine triphosphatase [Parcubacteria group bacterium Gr01-1014_33]|nr:MAG: 7,8-dihydro-8-oxoguanine triphosphatase [Parcubacteria group bacterium Gr01-1014_33]
MTYEKINKLHIVAVVAVIRNEEGRYLVLERHENEVAYPGMYTFPGGKVEGNDTVEETLIKEVEEEAGLKLKPGKILLKDKTFLRSDGQTAKFFSYLCEVENFESVTISEEFSDYKWVSSEDLKSIPHVGIEEDLNKADNLYRSGFSLALFQTKSVREGE